MRLALFVFFIFLVNFMVLTIHKKHIKPETRCFSVLIHTVFYNFLIRILFFLSVYPFILYIIHVIS